MTETQPDVANQSDKPETSKSLSEKLYYTCGGRARDLRTIIQFVIGSYVFFIVVAKPVLLVMNVFLPGCELTGNPILQYIAYSPILLLVGHALAFSAAVELAYMLFTAQLDEAIDPLIIGVASASLILISDEHPDSWSEAIFILFAAISLFILFRLRHNERKEQGRNVPRDG